MPPDSRGTHPECGSVDTLHQGVPIPTCGRVGRIRVVTPGTPGHLRRELHAVEADRVGVRGLIDPERLTGTSDGSDLLPWTLRTRSSEESMRCSLCHALQPELLAEGVRSEAGRDQVNPSGSDRSGCGDSGIVRRGIRRGRLEAEKTGEDQCGETKRMGSGFPMHACIGSPSGAGPPSPDLARDAGLTPWPTLSSGGPIPVATEPVGQDSDLLDIELTGLGKRGHAVVALAIEPRVGGVADDGD